MDFSMNGEQQMLLDTTRRWLAEHYGFEQRRARLHSQEPSEKRIWQQLAELGLLALNVPEEMGGSGAGPDSTLWVCAALGEVLMIEPYISSAVLATTVIATLANAAQRTQWLASLASGDQIAVVAHEEDVSFFDATDVLSIRTRAQHAPGEWILNGQKNVVYHAPEADLLLLSAQTAAQQIGLFAVHRSAPGLHLRSYRTVDGQNAADVVLSHVRVTEEATLGTDVASALSAALDTGIAALCADALGALDQLLAITIDYSRTRKQFGQPIGSFQVLRHRMADMRIHAEQARSMAYLAASSCAGPDALARRRAISEAKVIIGQAARFIGQQAVQIHGGMGMTDELNVSHYFKRLLAFEIRFGSTQTHLQACARHHHEL